MSIDRDGVDAPYVQLAAIIRERITSGEIPPGRRIPSMTEIEAEYGLARGTIYKAFALLKEEGLVVASRGRGLFVVEQETRPDQGE